MATAERTPDSTSVPRGPAASGGFTAAGPGSAGSTGGAGGKPRRRRLRRTIGIAVLAAVLLVLVPTAWSYEHALTRPGNESVGIRTTEWVREHGGRGLVAWTENFWYSHHAPKKGGVPPARALPTVAPPPSTVPAADVPAPVRLLASPALPGEGQWQAT
ncbi:MAG TPA: hypothetical protein VMU14_06200, partial [Acidimicrobiales bacterium]|nr:hypothetical protein [Acidimicrobiales bacterium]